VDGDGRKKPLWYATRRFFGDVVWTFQPEKDGSLSFFVVNDTDALYDAPIMMFRGNFVNGSSALAEHKVRLNVPPRSSRTYLLPASFTTPTDPTREMLIAGIGGALWFFAPDKELNYPPPDFDADWSGGKLAIHAHVLLRDVCVFVDRLDPNATVSEQLVTILPEQSFTFEIHSNRPLTKEQLTSPPVFQCANRFGKTRM
jgi:beta-mannosidase